MHLFDSAIFFYAIHIMSFFRDCVTIFLLIVIFLKSPVSMGRYKRMMWKMAVTDILFGISISWLLLPNVMFPLPAATVLGLMRHFGQIGASLATTCAVSSCAATLLSVNDCCTYRLLIFFKKQEALEKFVGLPGFLLCVFAHLAIVVIVGGSCVFLFADYEELLAYSKRNNVTELLASIPPETPFVAIDVEKASSIIFAIIISIFLICTEVANVGMSLAVRSKIMESRATMSKETFRMQKSLTKVLLAQTIIPLVCIVLPVIIYTLAIFTGKYAFLLNPIVELVCIISVGIYPILNSAFCLFCMKPYREFTARLVCFWKRPKLQQVTRIAPSDFSITSAT